MSSRAVPSREATPPHSRCSPHSRDPGPQAAAQRRDECRVESLLGAGAPPGARNLPPPRPIGMREEIQLVWNVGPTGLRVSRAAGKAGPTQRGPEGVRSQCHPRATPHVAAAPPGRECVRGRCRGGS